MSDDTHPGNPNLPTVAGQYDLVFDSADARQIRGDPSLQEALVYEVTSGNKTVRQLTYKGVKMLVLKMSQIGQPLAPVGEPRAMLMKYDEHDPMTWVWEGSARMRNESTGYETVGSADVEYAVPRKDQRTGKPMFDKKTGKPLWDKRPFGRITACSKAERNAMRKQIPEAKIEHLIATAKGEEVENLPDPARVLHTTTPSTTPSTAPPPTAASTTVPPTTTTTTTTTSPSTAEPPPLAEPAAPEHQTAAEEAGTDPLCVCKKPSPGAKIPTGPYKGIPACANCSKVLRTADAIRISNRRLMAGEQQ